MFVSDEDVWCERVTARFNELDNPDVATWERIQRQREGFREWEPGTALFIDSMNPLDKNFRSVLDFVQAETVNLNPIPAVPLEAGRYHE